MVIVVDIINNVQHPDAAVNPLMHQDGESAPKMPVGSFPSPCRSGAAPNYPCIPRMNP